MGHRTQFTWMVWWVYGALLGLAWGASIYLVAQYWSQPIIPLDPLLRLIETIAPARFHELISSWLGFGERTLLGVAVPILTLVFSLYIAITLLIWREGDPYVTTARLPELVSLGLFGSLYASACAGLLVAFFGWPILWIAEQHLGLSAEMKEWVTFLLSPNYISMSAVGAVTAIAIAALVLEAKGGSKPRLRRSIADKLDIWWATRDWPYPALAQDKASDPA